jgi:hypothetical protein
VLLFAFLGSGLQWSLRSPSWLLCSGLVAVNHAVVFLALYVLSLLVW